MRHRMEPKYAHNCEKCRFLGQTIGGQKIHDLYVCDTLGPDRSPTLIARYGDEGGEYLSVDANYAHANGHAELFAAADLWRKQERTIES